MKPAAMQAGQQACRACKGPRVAAQAPGLEAPLRPVRNLLAAWAGRGPHTWFMAMYSSSPFFTMKMRR